VGDWYRVTHGSAVPAARHRRFTDDADDSILFIALRRLCLGALKRPRSLHAIKKRRAFALLCAARAAARKNTTYMRFAENS